MRLIVRRRRKSNLATLLGSTADAIGWILAGTGDRDECGVSCPCKWPDHGYRAAPDRARFAEDQDPFLRDQRIISRFG
jgi:hypothetical protein